MTLALWAIVGVGLLEAGATWWLVRASRRLTRVDERLSQLTEALRLLAETTEAGFKANAVELTRVAEQAATLAARAVKPAPVPRPEPAASPSGNAKPRARRPAAPPSRGARVAKDTVPGQEISEAELRLRLHLAETVGARTAAGRENGRALRA
jgi:hypothetical protein